MDWHVEMLLLGVVGYGLVMVLVLVLFRVSSDHDRNSRHAEKELIPHSDVTITHFGNG